MAATLVLSINRTKHLVFRYEKFLSQAISGCCDLVDDVSRASDMQLGAFLAKDAFASPR